MRPALPLVYSGGMDDDEYLEDDFFSALFVALHRREELDPEARNELWFKLLESTIDKTLTAHFEKMYKARKKLH